MKKYAFLTCDDLTDFVVDDELAYKEFDTQMIDDTYDLVVWSDPKVEWSDYDFAIIRTTWDYTKKLEHFLKTLKNIEESGCQLLNPYSVIEWNARKTYLNDLEQKGVNTIPSIFLGEVDERALIARLKSINSDKYVFKPTVGASAEKIEIVESKSVLKKFKEIENTGDWFLQPFIKEVLKGEVSYFFFGGEYSHAVSKVPKSGDFRVQEEHGGIISLHHADDIEIEQAREVIKTLDEDLLYARVDMLMTAEGPKLIELELIEPSLYFRIDPQSAKRYIKTLKNWSRGQVRI